jgi:hypothetical protein
MKRLAYVLDERGLVTLKGKVHSLVQPVHSLSEFMPRFQSVLVVQSSAKQLFTSNLTAQNILKPS